MIYFSFVLENTSNSTTMHNILVITSSFLKFLSFSYTQSSKSNHFAVQAITKFLFPNYCNS